MQVTRSLLLACALLAAATGGAQAHPHVFIDVKSDLVFDGDGRLVAVRHVWRFDEGYSAFASQGLDTDGDGTYSTEELAPLAEVNIESLKDFGYFTFGAAGDREISFTRPTEYWLRSDDGLLTLYFTLPTETPVEVRSLPADIEVSDPTFYVAFAFVEQQPVTLENAPAGCNTRITEPQDLDPSVAAALAEVGPDQRELPPDLQALVVGQTNTVVLSCP